MLRTIYFKYAKYSLGLSSWTSNQYLIKIFGLINPDVTVPMRVIDSQNNFKTLDHPRVTLQSIF